MAEITAKEMLDALLAFPSNGTPPADERLYQAWIRMEAMGLISAETQTAPCRTCGTPRVTNSYYRIAPSGRALIEIAQSDKDEF